MPKYFLQGKDKQEGDQEEEELDPEDELAKVRHTPALFPPRIPSAEAEASPMPELVHHR